MPSEADTINAVDHPGTVASVAADIARLGVERGDVLIVHSSMSAIGWVAGGAQAVVEALLGAVGPDGTIVVPTQTGQLSDPADWEDPPVPEKWHDLIRAGFPAYDPDLTPSRGMGVIPEAFRHAHGTVRSPHPLSSFAANGADAATIVGEHPLEGEFGERSPLGRLYELDAHVLLIGVDHGNNTSLHLAEHRSEWPGKSTTSRGAPVAGPSGTEWVTWTELDHDSDDFAELGEAFAATGAEHVGRVGGAVARRCSQRAVVDFGTEWLATNRRPA